MTVADQEPHAEKSKAEISRAREVARALAKTLKAFLLYPPSNPLPGEFKLALLEALNAFTAENGALALTPRNDELLFADEPVHRDAPGEEGLAAALARDGIRSVTFSSGIEASELDAFLAALRRGLKERGGDEDLATLLWQAGLKRIAYDAIGELEDSDDAAREKAFWAKAAERERSGRGGTGTGAAAGGAAGTGGGGAGAGAGGGAGGGAKGAGTGASGAGPGLGGGAAQAGAAAELGSRAAAAPPKPIESMEVAAILNRLADFSGDSALLEEVRAEAAAFEPVGAAIAVLLEILGGEDDPADFGATAGLLEGLYDGFVDRSDFAAAARVLEAAAEFAREEKGSSRGRRLSELLDRAASEAGVARLRAALDADPAADLAAARRLLSALPEEAFTPLVDALGVLERAPARRLVCDVLVERGAGRVEAVGRAAADPRWYVVRNAAMILGRIGGPEACRHLERALAHAEEAVRREAVEALARLETPEARRALRAGLRDPSAALRLRALRALARRGDAEDGASVEARVLDASFRGLPEEEQAEWLSALARLKGDAALPAFRALIRRRLLDWGARARLRPLAALALGDSTGPESAAFLAELARGNDARVRDAAELALSRLARRGEGR